MKKIKHIILSALALCASSAWAQQEVIKIKYSDGLTDYIPVEDISKITFLDGFDEDIPGFTELNTLFDWSKEAEKIYPNQPFDFGYPAIMISLDALTEDCFSLNSSYNWFISSYYRKHGCNAFLSQMTWSHLYNYIWLSNNLLKEAENTTAHGQILKAQAYAMRSFAYWNLVQLYAPNYAVSPDSPAIPIIGDDTTKTVSSYDLSTVKEVYDIIMSDIDAAINLLKQSELNPAIIDISNTKRFVSLDVAYGLRARYNLTMHRYAEAAADAQAAIDNSSARPLLPAAAAYPGFCNAKTGNWMWGIPVNAEDRATTSGLLNFQGWMCSFCTYGYVSVGQARYCSTRLYNYLEANPSDVRNYWFTNRQGKGLTLSVAQQKQLKDNNIYDLAKVNVKFNMRDVLTVNGHLSMSDVPLMRIEEMYYILAEGLAMSGDVNGAKQVLTSFVNTYRDTNFVCQSTTATELQEDILWQRRAELWGEGLVYFDYLRLQRDIDLLGEDIDGQFQYQIRGTSKWMIYDYPSAYPYINGYEYDAYNLQPSLDGWNE